MWIIEGDKIWEGEGNFVQLTMTRFFEREKKKGKRERKIRDSIFKRNEGLTSETWRVLSGKRRFMDCNISPSRLNKFFLGCVIVPLKSKKKRGGGCFFFFSWVVISNNFASGTVLYSFLCPPPPFLRCCQRNKINDFTSNNVWGNCIGNFNNKTRMQMLLSVPIYINNDLNLHVNRWK